MHRTTVMLPDDLRLQAARLARESGMSLGEAIRESLENWLQSKKQPPIRDPLFHGVPVSEVDAPKDYSINHDKYLYGE
jgi:hypothetical protein